MLIRHHILHLISFFTSAFIMDRDTVDFMAIKMAIFLASHIIMEFFKMMLVEYSGASEEDNVKAQDVSKTKEGDVDGEVSYAKDVKAGEEFATDKSVEADREGAVKT